MSSLVFDMGEIHLRLNYHADKIRKLNKLLAVISEKRPLLGSTLVRRYGAEKLGRYGKETGKKGGGKGKDDGISVEIVCSIPAGKSLINSKLARNRLKEEKKKKRK